MCNISTNLGRTNTNWGESYPYKDVGKSNCETLGTPYNSIYVEVSNIEHHHQGDIIVKWFKKTKEKKENRITLSMPKMARQRRHKPI